MPRASRAARRLKAVAVLAVAVLVAGAARPAYACGSCRGPGGAGSALTAPWQTWGASVTQTMRLGHGISNADSEYRPFRGESHDRVIELAVAAAVRPIDAIELGATTAYGHVLVGGPSFRSGRAALGDLSLRARWEALDEPAIDLPNGPRRPSLGLTLSLRLPTGTVDRTGDAGSGPSPGTVGSTATSQGLGTTEIALAVDVRKTFAQKWQLGGVAEAAYRAPDESIGLARALGPRGLVRAMWIMFLGDATVGAFVDLAGETDVAYGGRTSPSSSQRAISIGASASLKTETGFRSGLALTFQPPIDGFSTNAVAATGLTTFVAFTK